MNVYDDAQIEEMKVTQIAAAYKELRDEFSKLQLSNTEKVAYLEQEVAEIRGLKNRVFAEWCSKAIPGPSLDTHQH